MATMQHADPVLVVELRFVKGDMLAGVGGKAANLGELTDAGMPVPPGFCITTEAYRRLTESTSLAQVSAEIDRADPSDATSLADLARRAREIVAAAPIPPGVASAVSEAYEALPGGPRVPVAVRSSATAEDLPTASFAGQQDTYLNVMGTPAVLDAVRRCWASLWTERAVSYRAVSGIDTATVALAVVVQRMVDADVAGVLFTADPITGARHLAVLEASPGLGEAVVSGAVNPDRFVVDTGSGRILERQLGDKRLAVRPVRGGGTERVVLPPGGDSPSVTDTQLRELVALGSRVESRFGSPQDIEWAVDGSGTIWLTQARPITTLFPVPPTKSQDDSPLRVFFCMSLAQGLHRPITPMGLSAFNVLGSSVAAIAGMPTQDPVQGPPAITQAAGRLFLDVTTLLRHPVGRVVFPKVLDVMEARSAVVLRRVLEDPRLAPRPGGRARFARRLARVAIHYRMPLVAAQALARPDLAHRRAERLESHARLRNAAPGDASMHERLDAVTGVLLEDAVPPLPSVAPAAAAGFVLLEMARRVLGEDARPGDLQTVLRGLPHNVTTEMDLDLWQVARQIRADDAARALVRDGDVADLVARLRTGTLPPVAQHGLESFLRRYGHRAVAEIDIGMPRWRENPTQLIGVLSNYLRLPRDAVDPQDEFLRAGAEAEAMIGTLTQRARARGRARATAVEFALRRTRQLAGLREMPKYLLILTLSGVRSELFAIGQHLASEGRLATAEDVFFLDLHDVRAAIDGADQRVLVRRRRETYDQELRRHRVPRVLLSDGTEPEAAAAPSSNGDALRGTPASPGTVTAPARVVRDPADAHLEPGEILVAPSTDPGWTPLFLTAGGLVMEMGGANSHGAVVAREYGIPAVVGVADATTRIGTGDVVQVDGTNGVVATPKDESVGTAASS